VIDFDEPFSGRVALAAGIVTRHRLARDFVHLHRDVYIRRGIPATPLLRAKAAWLWSQGRGVLAGVSAAAVHGTGWLDPDAAAELVRAEHVRSVPGISVRRAPRLETCVVDGMVVTTPAQTAFDIGRRMPLDRAIETIDALCNATGLKVLEIEELATRSKGAHGIGAVPQVLALVDGGAASPPETRTRLLLVRAGLPSPETQLEIFGDTGFVARADMGWRQWRVLVEYDGAHHWTDPTQRTRDIDRYAVLSELGWTVIRVGADLLRRRPEVVVDRVRRALRTAGAPV